jgi:hypothetical protein
VFHVLHEADTPEYEDDPIWGRVENFTTVDVGAFRDALDATQAIRHARSTGDDGAALTERHVTALGALGQHPALFAISDELVERAQVELAGRDAAERARARAYYEALDPDERARRREMDYTAEHEWQTPHDQSTVDVCPVCGARALVGPVVEGVIGEIGIGFCFVCSYRRTAEVAEEEAFQIDLERSIERAMERDD